MDRNIFIKTINDKAKFYTKELWDIDYDGEVIINNRLKSTYGWFLERDNKIEFNKSLINLDEYFIDEVLIHELCHWYCFKIGVDNDDGSFEFEKEIYNSGSRSTETVDSKDGELWLCDEESWFYCETCDDSKKIHRIKRSERINHYGVDIEKAKPVCPICGRRLTYYCEANYDNRWVKYYPRKKLLDLNFKFKNIRSE